MTEKVERHLRDDAFTGLKRAYDAAGGDRSNLRYGYVNRRIPVDENE